MVRLIERINVATSELHADVDSELLRGPVSARAYQRYLARTYGFIAPVERSICTTPEIDRYVDLRRFNKEELLRRDLLALHFTSAQVNELPQCMVPLFDTAAQALGWAYFVERASLAHNATFRHLAASIPGEIAFAASYLKCYFGSVGEMWRVFGDTLERLASTGEHAARASIDAATAAFSAYKTWQRSTAPLRSSSSSGSLPLSAVADPRRDDDTLA